MKAMGSSRRASIGAIAFNVAIIHAAGLVLLSQSQPGAIKGQGGAGASRSHVVQMRLATATTPPAQVVLPQQSPALPSNPAQALPESPTVATASDMPPDAPAFSPLVVDDILSDVTTADAGPDTRPSGSEYIPRPQLSAAPRPSVPVIVPFPKEITTPGRYTAILALFIDETGVVRRVRIDSPSLPSPLEDAAKETFLQAHFSPGEVDGQQVKSLIRVEVVFDNSPIEPAAAQRSL